MPSTHMLVPISKAWGPGSDWVVSIVSRLYNGAAKKDVTEFYNLVGSHETLTFYDDIL